MDSQRPADAMKPAPASPQKILIVKLSAIGDVIQTLPMLAALRRRFPEAEIDWVVEEEAAGLLKGYPGIDRVLVSRRKSWQREIRGKGRFAAALREIIRFVKDLRKIEYDWVIDNHGVLKSGILVALCRGDKKIGYRATAGIADEGSYFFTNERHQPLSIERHALERYLDLVGQLGVPIEEASLEFPVPPDSLETVRRILDRKRLQRPSLSDHPSPGQVGYQAMGPGKILRSGRPSIRAGGAGCDHRKLRGCDGRRGNPKGNPVSGPGSEFDREDGSRGTGGAFFSGRRSHHSGYRADALGGGGESSLRSPFSGLPLPGGPVLMETGMSFCAKSFPAAPVSGRNARPGNAWIRLRWKKL